MQPVRITDLTEEVAHQMGYPPSVITGVLSLYYNQLRNHLTILSSPKIKVANLGTFSLKPRRLQQRLSNRVNLLQRLTDKPVNEKYRNDVGIEVSQVVSANEKLIGEKERKVRFKKEKSAQHVV